MKILYTNAHLGNGGGHATYIVNLAASFNKEHDVYIATPSSSRLYALASNVSNVTCLPTTFSSRFFTMLAETRRLYKLLRDVEFDVVHVNGSSDHKQAILACAFLPTPPKIVWTKHNTMPVSSIGHRLRANVGTAGVIGVCDKVSELLHRSSYQKLAIKTIRLGVHLERFAPVLEPEWRSARQRFLGDIGNEVLVLGSVGGTDLDKGWLVLARAISQLPKTSQKRLRLLVAGDPPAPAVRAEVDSLGLQDIVIFPGLVSDPASVLAASDIGFVFSFHEAGSYAACESLAMGLPTLVSNAGGLPELVRNEVDGWVLPAGDVQAVQSWLQALLDNGYPLAMKKAARERVLKICFL